MHLQENSVGLSAQVQGPREEWELAGEPEREGWRGRPQAGGTVQGVSETLQGLWINWGVGGDWSIGV